MTTPPKKLRELKQTSIAARFTDSRNLSDDTVLADAAGEFAPLRNTK
ncbi:MAG: hypothetical protein K0B16_15775 [Burkholderiaceae bacterium]|nr:hypothetical protein [Burkholderiaceae bacterium]